MENQRNFKVPKLKSLDGVISPINVPNFVGGRRFQHSPLSPILDPYASDNSEPPSPLMKYLCSGSPALGATVPSSPVFATPLKVEEDVLVMDGIPVPKSNKGGRARGRPTLISLSLNSTSLSQVGGVGAETSSSNKADICRHWEDSGICRLDFKCQLAHGKEELRPRFSAKNKSEIFNPYISSSGSGSSSHGKSSCSVKQLISASTTAAALSLPTPPKPVVSSTSTLEIKRNSVFIYDSKVPSPSLSCSNWSPLDDGIEITLPPGLSEGKKIFSKEDLEAQIQRVLYGTGSTKRLPVFSQSLH
ncbi:hypothetical protein F511_26918 [Dorcoceras hygrometricum]|uniref:C3H1-type domain-containing protein n=1 Tax=Dorcoceras hygrometricum TaxID=472368 RepID=A0A2Z7DGZ7_9LAMI|nr:hypothetical protein F511_26918 [Dorcoceras hygrometricum]